MPLEPRIIVDAGDPIVVLGDQFLEARGEGGLLIRAIRALQSAADSFLSGCLVIVVPSLIAAPVRRRLIQS